MKLFAGLEPIVKTGEPLAPHTWFGIGGPALYFVEPRTVEELIGPGDRLLGGSRGVGRGVRVLHGAEFLGRRLRH